MRRALTLSLFGACAIAVLVGVFLTSRSDDAGAAGTGGTITVVDASATVGEYSSLVLDGAGNPVVSYYDETNGDLKVVRCGDPACSSGNTITTPDSAGDVGRNTSIALNASGHPVISYTGGGGLKVLTCGDATCSSGNTIATPDPTGGGASSLTLDGDSLPVVAYASDSPAIAVLLCGNATCTAGNTIVEPDPEVVGATFSASLALDAVGNPVVAYRTPSGPRLVRCGNPTCAAGNVANWLGTLAEIDEALSMVLDSSDRPIIAFDDILRGRNGNLKVVHCGDTACASGNVLANPDNGANTGIGVTAVLGGDGNPRLSYWQIAGGTEYLKVLTCGNPGCTAGNTLSSVDEGTTSFTYRTSITIDAGGRPVVSYHDGSALLVLHCGNATCGGKSLPALPTEEPDSDFDGCTDATELGSDAELGGRRDPDNFWDLYDPTGDITDRPNATVDLFGDIFGVAFRFGAIGDPAGNPNLPAGDMTGYHTRFDRSAPPTEAEEPDPSKRELWDLGPPNGTIDLFTDVFGVAFQFGHKCAGP